MHDQRYARVLVLPSLCGTGYAGSTRRACEPFTCPIPHLLIPHLCSPSLLLARPTPGRSSLPCAPPTCARARAHAQATGGLHVPPVWLQHLHLLREVTGSHLAEHPEGGAPRALCSANFHPSLQPLPEGGLSSDHRSRPEHQSPPTSRKKQRSPQSRPLTGQSPLAALEICEREAARQTF